LRRFTKEISENRAGKGDIHRNPKWRTQDCFFMLGEALMCSGQALVYRVDKFGICNQFYKGDRHFWILFLLTSYRLMDDLDSVGN
jgi:hypothetical protein